MINIIDQRKKSGSATGKVRSLEICLPPDGNTNQSFQRAMAMQIECLWGLYSSFCLWGLCTTLRGAFCRWGWGRCKLLGRTKRLAETAVAAVPSHLKMRSAKLQCGYHCPSVPQSSTSSHQDCRSDPFFRY